MALWQQWLDTLFLRVPLLLGILILSAPVAGRLMIYSSEACSYMHQKLYYQQPTTQADKLWMRLVGKNRIILGNKGDAVVIALARHQRGLGFEPPASMPYVVWACCCFSPLLREVFLWVSQFAALLKNQHFQIRIRSGTQGYVSTKSQNLLRAPWGNTLQFTVRPKLSTMLRVVAPACT